VEATVRLSLPAALVLVLTVAGAGPVTAQQPRPPQPQPPAQRPQPPRPDTIAQRAARQDSLLRAQQARLDSLAGRVDSAEDAMQRLQRQLEEQAQSKVQSRLRNKVEISGLILINGFYEGAKFNNADVPQFVAAAQDLSGLPNASLGATIRQTRLGISASGATALGGDLSGDVQVDFYGGQPRDLGARLFSLVRIRTASIRIDWPHFGILIGQESPLVAQQNPVSFASSGFPDFAAAGNLWLWIPQARLTYETGNSLRIGLQAAALAPILPDSQLPFLTQADLGERSGRPSLEGRLYVGWGSDETESAIGFGVHRGWIAIAGDTTVASQAVTADFRIVIGAIALAGEAFSGQALAGLGGGGVGQNLAADSRPVRTRGGWVQLNIRPSFEWEFGGGYGMDDPNDSDLLVAACDSVCTSRVRRKNVVYEGHLHWRPGGGLLLGAEFRRLQTTYFVGPISANHVNMFAGLAF
jgi:hypothetical protein